ncbi:MAG: hypothetical protein ABSG69_02875 [Candidatus Acidiferrum sp.]|jgi:ABC-type phosphate transport system substrate-binding protein
MTHRKILLLRLRAVSVACLLLLLLTASATPAVRNTAVITAAGNKLNDVPLADLIKLCKGTQKVWPDGRNFTLVITDPDSPGTRMVVEKLLGAPAGDLKAFIAKLNETRLVVKVVDTDDSVMAAVSSIPGAIGLVDVYSINSSVKVLRLDGKLPFDVGYALKGNA